MKILLSEAIICTSVLTHPAPNIRYLYVITDGWSIPISGFIIHVVHRLRISFDY